MVGKTGLPQPVVAEMEEAMPSAAAIQSCGASSRGQSRRDGRLAVLEELRDGNTPIELDFSLQNLTQSQLNSGADTTAVTAIAPAQACHAQPIAFSSASRPGAASAPLTASAAIATALPTFSAAETAPGGLSAKPCRAPPQILHDVLVGAVLPSVRSTGRRLGRQISQGAGAVVRLSKRTAGRGVRLSMSATRLAGGAVVRSARAAGGAVSTGVRTVALQPGRLVRFVREKGRRKGGERSRQRNQAAASPAAQPPGGSVASSPQPAATRAAAAGPAGAGPAAASSDASATVALRARPLFYGSSSPVRRGYTSQPYVAVTATPVPALLTPGGLEVVSVGGRGSGAGGGGTSSRTEATGTSGGSVTSGNTNAGANAGPPAAAAATAPAPAAAATTPKRPTGPARPVAGERHVGARRRVGAGAVAALAGRPVRVALAAAKGVAVTAKYGATALLCAFFPKSCRVLGLAALLSGPTLPLLPTKMAPRNPLYSGPLTWLLAPLAPLHGPFAAFAAMRLVCPLVVPSVWRNVMYWQRTVPIITRYLVTGRRAAALRKRGRPDAAAELWDRQHEWGAGAIFDMLADLKGFYLKLGQILASKTDMLPQPYTESLSRLLDRLPPAPYRVVRSTIARELGAQPESLFRELDPFPLASATIAQVHRGMLPDGQPVVVKVQHGPARRMMRSDLANLAALSGLMEAAGLRLGFDHASLIREYNIQVPLEFDFAREARVASAIRTSLERASATFPALRRVVVPRMVPSHSTRRVLTMEYLDGVPLLDIAHMELAVRHELMTSLILAYGIMILRDGLFHSDPHPGNVLAMRCRRKSLSALAATTGGAGTGPGSALVGALVSNSVSSSSSAQPSAIDLVTHPTGGFWPGGPAGGMAAGGAGGEVGFTGLASHPEDAVGMLSSYNHLNHHHQQHDWDELQVALLDFGQAKQLSPTSRARYALLVAAMAVRDDELVLAVSSELGLLVENCSPQFAAVASYILFDTRMDFPEAHMGPMDPEAHEFRTAKVPSLPQDLFMIMRSITLLRGLLSSLQVDISSAQLWRPLALQVLADLTPIYRVAALIGPEADAAIAAADPAAQMASDLADVVPLDFSPASSGGTVMPSPAVARAVLAAATQRGRSSGGGAAVGSGSNSPRVYDKAAAEALRRAEKAEREAAEAERKRLSREVAAAARRKEEARRRAEWEETMRRKREEQEAKAAKLKAQKAEAEARKAAERAERELRKRAEIEAHNARRQAEWEASEARKKAEREAAEANRQRSRSNTPVRNASRDAPVAPPSPTLPTPPAGGLTAGGKTAAAESGAGRPAAAVAGIIHSPMPVRFAPVPYSSLSTTSASSRLGQASGPYGTNSRYGGIHQATGDVSLHDAVAQKSPSPQTGAGAVAAPPPLASVVRPGSPLTTAGTAARAPAVLTNPAGGPASSAGGSRFAPPTPPRIGVPIAVQPASLGSDGESAITGAGAAAGGGDGLQATPVRFGSDGRPPAPAPLGSGGDSSRLSVSLRQGGGGDDGDGDVRGGADMDEMTSRLVARANQFAAVTDGVSPGSPGMSAPTAAVPGMAPGAGLRMATVSSSPRSPGAMATASSATNVLTSGGMAAAAAAATAVAGGGGASGGGPPSDGTSTSNQELNQQVEQLQQLQQQLMILQQQQQLQNQGLSPNTSPPLSQSTAQTAAAAAAVAAAGLGGSGSGSSRPGGQLQTSQQPAGAAADLDIYAQARALLETTRKLLPNQPATATTAAQAAAGPSAAVGLGGPGGSPVGLIGVGAGGAALPHPPSPSAASSDSYKSRQNRNGSDKQGGAPSMFLPLGMRSPGALVADVGGIGAAGAAAGMQPGSVLSTTMGLVGGGGLGSVAEIEPAQASNSAGQPGSSTNGAAAAGGVPAGSPYMEAAVVSVQMLGGPGAAGEMALSSVEMAIAAAAAGSGGGPMSGEIAAATNRTTGTVPDVLMGTGGGGGGMRRTVDGMTLQTGEDLSMWVARQQANPHASQPGSIPSARQSLTGPIPQPVATAGVLPGLPQQLSPQSLVQPIPGVIATQPGVGGGLPVTGASSWAPMGGGAATAGAAASGAASGSKASGTSGGKATSSSASSGSSSKKGGMETVKQGLSRLGRKIVGGLTAP